MRLTKRQLKRIIREEYTRLKRRGLIKESVGEYGGDPIDTITMYIEELHDSGESAFNVWNKISELDRKANAGRLKKISSSFRVSPVADVIHPEDTPTLWKLWDRGQFLEYRDAIRSRLEANVDEQWLQSLADEISLEFGRMSIMKNY